MIDIGEEKDPAILIECGIHAREWVSVAFCPFLIDQILSKNWERDGIRWVIFPMMNPDGYRKDRTGKKKESRSLFYLFKIFMEIQSILA